MKLIAELGSNPAPEWDLRRWCEEAAGAGATHVKIQLWRPEHFPESERADKRWLEFPRSHLGKFAETAHGFGLQAGASVFDGEAIEIVARRCDFLKLAAREVNNPGLTVPTLAAGQRYGKPVYRSVPDLTWGYSNRHMTLLYVIPEYPTPMWKALVAVVRAAVHFRKLESPWGWSSHTTGWLDCWLAAKLGASVVEKHFALSKDDVEAGHSLTPDAFQRLAERIR